MTVAVTAVGDENMITIAPVALDLLAHPCAELRAPAAHEAARARSLGVVIVIVLVRVLDVAHRRLLRLSTVMCHPLATEASHHVGGYDPQNEIGIETSVHGEATLTDICL
jgi:hypothetical protein